MWSSSAFIWHDYLKSTVTKNMHLPRLLSQAIGVSVAAGLTLSSSSNLTVHLPYASFEGIVDGNTTQFLGMPFAKPP
jgi:hypothetical protein